MNIYAQIAVKIIKAQEAIIGPVAVEQAERVNNLAIDWTKHEVSINSEDEVSVLEELIEKYQDLFGQISVEVSRESAASLLSQLHGDQLPEALK